MLIGGRALPPVDSFLATIHAVKGRSHGITDISGQFVFRTWSNGRYWYKEASGELGVPGRVLTHGDLAAQRAMPSGTGEHAGHMIGIQFGAPGDIRNLGLQNPNMNTFAPRPLHVVFRGHGGAITTSNRIGPRS